MYRNKPTGECTVSDKCPLAYRNTTPAEASCYLYARNKPDVFLNMKNMGQQHHLRESGHLSSEILLSSFWNDLKNSTLLIRDLFGKRWKGVIKCLLCTRSLSKLPSFKRYWLCLSPYFHLYLVRRKSRPKGLIRSRHKNESHLKKCHRALAGVAQWTEHWPANQSITGWFPVRARAWVVGQVSSRERQRGNHTLMFLSHLPFSINK